MASVESQIVCDKSADFPDSSLSRPCHGFALRHGNGQELCYETVSYQDNAHGMSYDRCHSHVKLRYTKHHAGVVFGH